MIQLHRQINCNENENKSGKGNIGIKRDVKDISINCNVYILLRFSFGQRNENTIHTFMR